MTLFSTMNSTNDNKGLKSAFLVSYCRFVVVVVVVLFIVIFKMIICLVVVLIHCWNQFVVLSFYVVVVVLFIVIFKMIICLVVVLFIVVRINLLFCHFSCHCSVRAEWILSRSGLENFFYLGEDRANFFQILLLFSMKNPKI